MSQQSFGAVLKQRAINTPDKIAYSFLNRNIDIELDITYAELDLAAMNIARRIAAQSSPGDRLLLVYPNGVEFIKAFWACLYAGVVAVPAYPPRANRNLERLSVIVKDSGTNNILTLSSIEENLKGQFDERLPIICTDLIDAGEPCQFGIVDDQQLALLQYTSGSTSDPKGVMVTHDNIYDNQIQIDRAFQNDDNSVVVSWLPFFHDMGLIGHVLHTVYIGARCILMSPVDFLTKPLRWLQAVSRYRCDTSGGPNFAFQFCVDKISEKDIANLDLSNWSIAFSGSEMIHAKTLQSFAKKFRRAGFDENAFMPCYGMAETTLFVSARGKHRGAKILNVDLRELQLKSADQRVLTEDPGKNVNAEKHIEHKNLSADEVLDIVSCGHCGDFELAIVDSNNQVLPERRVGEIWLQGKSVAAGYWQVTEGKFDSFCAYLSDGRGPFYKTGDLGFIEQGELYITGRAKELIILRGSNYYPYDIERVATQSCEAVINGGCAAFSVQSAVDERLVLVCELNHHKKKDTVDVFRDIHKGLAEHYEIRADEIVLIKRNQLPKTSSGKIQRSKCKKMYLSDEFSFVASSNESHAEKSDAGENCAAVRFIAQTPLEQRLYDLLKPRLGTLSISREDSFFSLGLDSIQLAQMSSLLSDELGFDVPVDQLFLHPSIAELAAILDTEHKNKAGGESKLLSLEGVAIGNSSSSKKLVAAETAEYYPLSYGQEGLWYDQQISPDSNSYNIPLILEFEQGVCSATMCKAVNMMVNRHEILRTCFAVRDQGPVQIVLPKLDVQLPLSDLSAEQGAAQDASFHSLIDQQVKPVFDLTLAPLFRQHLVKLAESSFRLIAVFHHIICDGSSLVEYKAQLCAIYENLLQGNPCPAEKAHALQYKDYALWQRGYHDDSQDVSLAYWTEQLASPLPDMQIPADSNRAFSAQVKQITTRWQQLSLHQSRALSQFSVEHASTQFVPLLTVFVALLAKLCRQSDIVVGTPVITREHADLQRMLGYFINPLMLRNHVDENASLRGLFENVKAGFVQAMKHKSYPFSNLLKSLNIHSTYVKFPISSVFFNGLTFDTEGQAEKYFRENLQTQGRFELNVYVVLVAENGIRLRWDYNSYLWQEKTIELYMQGFSSLLDQLLSNCSLPFKQLNISSRSDCTPSNLKQKPVELTQHPLKLFHDVVRKQPQNLAIVSETHRLSYLELSQLAATIATALQNSHAGPIVGVYVSQNHIHLAVAALLGVLQSGAAFVVLDQTSPASRLQKIIDDAEIATILADSKNEGVLASPNPSQEFLNILHLDQLSVVGGALDGETSHSLSAEDLAYILYTSGSTGEPKGVLQTCGSLAHVACVYKEYFHLGSQDRLTLLSTLNFDAALVDVFSCLSSGATLYSLDLKNLNNLSRIDSWLNEHELTVWHSTPSLYRFALPYIAEAPSLRHIVLGGERVNDIDLFKHRERLAEIPLSNLYGQSEHSISAIKTYGPNNFDEVVSVGRPTVGHRLSIEDDKGQAVQVYQTGELVIESPVLSTGYLKRRQLTHTVFDGQRFKTGDLARFLPNGDIQIIGRNDNQIKVRGHRVEIEEIESAIMAWQGLERAIVIPQFDGDDCKLFAYVQCAGDPAKPNSNEGVDIGQLRQHLRESLPEYMLPADIFLVDKIALTANNKVDRVTMAQLLPEAVAADNNTVVAETETQKILVELFKRVLDIGNFSVSKSFFELGGHSITAVKLIHGIEQSFDRQISLAELYTNSTVTGLARQLEQVPNSAVALPTLVAVDSSDNYPLSSSQLRIWIQSQLTPYNITRGIGVNSKLDAKGIEHALQRCIGRHEILRSIFIDSDTGLQQVVLEPSDQAFGFEVLDWRDCSSIESELEKLERREVARSMDFSQLPLLYVYLIFSGEQQSILYISIHHIISDGWSMEVLARELLTNYQQYNSAEPATADQKVLPLQYRDFAVWQQQLRHHRSFIDSRVYWCQKFANGIARLNLRLDRPRQESRSFSGGLLQNELSIELSVDIREFVKNHQTTLFLFLLSCMNLFFYKSVNQKRVVLGTLTAGRHFSRRLSEQIGFYANTLALSVECDETDSFVDLLAKTAEDFHQSEQHQLYPIEELADDLALSLEPGRALLFDVLVVLHSTGGIEQRLAQETGMNLYALPRFNVQSKFDLTVNFNQYQNTIGSDIEFNADLFDADSVDAMWQELQDLIIWVIANPDEQVTKFDPYARFATSTKDDALDFSFEF